MAVRPQREMQAKVGGSSPIVGDFHMCQYPVEKQPEVAVVCWECPTNYRGLSGGAAW